MTYPKNLISPEDSQDTKGWNQIPIGGVITSAGNSIKYKTGNWSPRTCTWNAKTCINCNLCWPVCPDDAILTDEEGNMVGVDPEKCKACGLCVTACPTSPKSLQLEEKERKEI